jgi:ketosteroid isomerase-like protein
MSRGNLERARAAIDAYNRKGPESFFDLLDPEIEWVSDRPDLGRVTFRGLDGVRQSFAEQYEAVSGGQFEVSDFREVGERVVAVGQLRARGRTTGIELQIPFGVVLTVGPNGTLVRFESFREPRRALEAVGLSE